MSENLTELLIVLQMHCVLVVEEQKLYLISWCTICCIRSQKRLLINTPNGTNKILIKLYFVTVFHATMNLSQDKI